MVTAKLATLSNASDTLDLWVKVQTAWMSLEPVFTGGDIAKQMPVEAKKFSRVDKDFVRVMAKSEELRTVVGACGNEMLINTLPIMHAELERAQKSLEGYLEGKRGRFPRFYFVSNPVLLAVLSQGSDPLAVQPFYEKLFDRCARHTCFSVFHKYLIFVFVFVSCDLRVLCCCRRIVCELRVQFCRS